MYHQMALPYYLQEMISYLLSSQHFDEFRVEIANEDNNLPAKNSFSLSFSKSFISSKHQVPTDYHDSGWSL